ncbi:MAG: glycosyltransferase family 4 protein [Alphaproteobacteria bacterium]|nr:glycosyltransferase family 4 protein [Alphaproteobacteria bacterium]MCW5744563.1 glycosyltransferase family 4 protein [Alphaproteobacteria bacterium]
MVPGFRRNAAVVVATAPPKIVIWHADEPPWMARRTLRRLRESGLQASSTPLATLADAIAGGRVAWLLRAGTLPSEPAMLRLAGPSSATLIGPPLDESGLPEGAWRDVFERQAGRLDGSAGQLEEPAIVSVGQPDALARHLHAAPGLMDAILRCGATHRLVPASGLGARRDPRPRVAICITSLHVGGAERVAAELARLLPRERVASRLFVLDRPQREALDAGPDAFLAYAGTARGAARMGRLRDALRAWGADVLSLHLLSSDALDALAALERPCLLTLHNDRQGWPPGQAEAARNMRLVIGCSLGVTRQARAEGLHPVRTAWNGVADRPASASGASTPPTRQHLAIAPDALVVLSIANDRPQKRLDRIAPIVACLRRAGVDAHAIVVGHRGDDRAAAKEFIHWIGPVEDIDAWLRLADVYLATSAYEGLSLSQIEAARSGLPIVATRTNGADELERGFKQCSFVDVDAEPRAFADAILALHTRGRGQASTVDDEFSAARMSRRYASLVRRVLADDTARDGVLFVCNDFAVGGAQSSLARLMGELRRRGVRCAAFLVGETRERSSPGTLGLQRAGHAIHAMPAAIQRDLPALAAQACAVADAGRYASIVYWNAITEMKLRIGDLAVGHRIFDVSPGEMYFRSLERYFASPAKALPFLRPADYGDVLDGVVVKYAREMPIAAEALGCPVHVIPNGVAPRPAATPSPGARMKLGTLCRIAPDKKLEQLLDAVRGLRARHDEFELLVGGAPDIGQEAYAAGLRAGAADLPVRWLGHVAAEEFLPGLDAFALVAEPAGCPNASLEAMAHGLAVVATDAGGMNEQVVDGVTGHLVARGDSHGLAGALERLLATPGLRAEMGREARLRAQRAFSLERMADGYMRVLGLLPAPA